LAPAFIIPLSSWYMRTFGFAVNWLAGGALVCAALTLPPSSSIYAQIAAALGRQSYATYLCHFWLGHEGLKAFADATGFDLDWNAYAVLYFVGSFMIGAILTCAIETPMLVLRNRLIPSWSAARRKAAGTTSTTPVSQPTPVLSPTSP
jgi:peptidoglycan/LPS O-acetylase OafA/YrhL